MLVYSHDPESSYLSPFCSIKRRKAKTAWRSWHNSRVTRQQAYILQRCTGNWAIFHFPPAERAVLICGFLLPLCADGPGAVVSDGRGADVRRRARGVGGGPAVPADDRQLAAVQPPQAMALRDTLHEPHQGGKALIKGPAPLLSFLPLPIFFCFHSIWCFLNYFFGRWSSLILLCIRSLTSKTEFLFESGLSWSITWN